MFNGLSYPSLRCVLEYLEANKRVHITVRSPVLQQFEKSIPLHLDQLRLGNNNTQINYIDLVMFYVSDASFNTTKMQKKCKIPERIDGNTARKTARFHHLDGRKDIYVNRLQFDFIAQRDPNLLFSNLRLKIREFDTCNHFRDGYLVVVHPSSFPLKKLRTEIKNDDDWNQDVLKTASTLVISDMDSRDEDWFIPNVANLANSKIVLERGFSSNETYLRLIQTYLLTPRGIGACLEFRTLFNETVCQLLDAAKVRFEGTDVRSKELVQRLSYPTPCFIKINSTSVALIYGIVEPFYDAFSDVRVQIISIDAITSVGSRHELEFAKIL